MFFYAPVAQASDMGSTLSRSSGSGQGWQPSPAGGTQERRVSKAGYDITPMTAEDREREAAKLTDFQRQVDTVVFTLTLPYVLGPRPHVGL